MREVLPQGSVGAEALHLQPQRRRLHEEQDGDDTHTEMITNHTVIGPEGEKDFWSLPVTSARGREEGLPLIR